MDIERLRCFYRSFFEPRGPGRGLIYAAHYPKVTIVANQKTLKNVKADDYWVGASFDVTVKDEKLAAKQTSANVITVTGTDLTDKVADYSLKLGTATKTLAKVEKKEDGTVLLTAGTSTLTKGTYTLTFGDLSTEFECAPSEVTSIEIVPEKAILKDGSETEAVAYYVVRDQFGDDVTKKAFSDLAISGSDLNDISKAGKVTFKTTSGKYNLNLSQVSLSIVNKTNGVVCSKVLTISENSKLSEVSLAGLYKVEGGSYKPVKSIPEGTLATGLANYVLLLTGVDQYGLEFPANKINKDNLSLTLSSVTGLQAVVSASSAAVTKEINDVEYFVVTLKNTSSDATTKGLRAGEVNVMGVVLTSGKTFADKFEVSNAVKIAKISISANGAVYGGQDNVLSYTVLDTEGNEIKDIDTLCQLNDTEFLKDFGKIKFVGSKDGTAVLKYTAASTTNKTMDTLSWISPTLEFGSTTLNIVPDRKAVAVVGTWSLPETGWNVGAKLTTTSGGNVRIALNEYKYEDQYGDLIPWYDYDSVVSGSGIKVSNEFKSASLPSYVSGIATGSGLRANAGAVTASSIQKVEVKTEVTVPGETNARKNEFSYQVAFVAIDDITGLAMGANHDTWKSVDSAYNNPTTSAAIGFWASGYYAGMGVDLQSSDYTVIDGLYNYINPQKVGYDKTVDDSASIVVKNNLGTVLKADVKVSNEKSKVVDADAYRASFGPGYRTINKNTVYSDFETDVWSKTQYAEVKVITPRVTFSNLPADTTKYELKDNGTTNPTLKFTKEGWYTVKAQYNFEGFVYDAILVFEVK